MSNQPTTIITRPVGDMLVAGIRFRGEYDEVSQWLAQLRNRIEPLIAGPGMLLHYFFDQSVEPGQDLEVCFPVSRPVEEGQVNSHVLEGGQMLCAEHRGPLGARGEAGSITDAWRAIFGHVRQHSVIVDCAPRREVYLAVDVTEAQLAYKFYRVEKLAENLERLAGPAVRQAVMAGSERYASCSYCERAEWYKAAMARLDGLVQDEELRREIMITVGDQFPRARIRAMREFYERTHDLDALLALMRADRTLGDRSWYETPVREGNIINVTKDPVLPQEYAKATTENEKRAAYCHCRLLAEAINAGLTISPTYCYCGAGWYQQLWDGIMGRPVRVDVLKSILQGDDRCSFAIHLG